MAILTPPGRGALAVAAVAGPGAEGMVTRLFRPRGETPLGDRPDGAIIFGRWHAGADGPGEDLVVVRRGRDDLEVHCHGGRTAVEAVVSSLENLGAVRQDWADRLRQGGGSEIEVEAREALCRAGGPKAARILTRQLAGLLEADFDRIARLRERGRDAEAACAIDRLLRASRVGLRLAHPWKVVLAGRVNAGKSSLVNAIAGHARSIVSAEPGTTRDLVDTRLVLDGWEVDLVDTAGLRDETSMDVPAGAVERAGIGRALAACAEADLVVHVVDSRDRAALEAAAVDAMADPQRHILAVSKADLTAADRPDVPGAPVWTSAVTDEGVELLVSRIVRALLPEEGDEPDLLAGAVPFSERQVAMLESWRAR